MFTRILVIALASAAVFAAAGCGGNGTSTEQSPTSTSTTPTKTFTITETDFKLDPSTVTIDAAGTYTFKAVNDGGTDHALEIEGNGAETKTDTIGAGEAASVTLDLEPGTYKMYCPIDGHRGMGMEGEISVGS